MKKLRISILSMVSFCCGGGHLHAQSQPAESALQVPILPMEIKFRHATQYLYQAIPEDARYSEITALIDGENCEVILLDKTMNRRAFYSNSQKRIDVLQAHGVDAYRTDLGSRIPATPRSVLRIAYDSKILGENRLIGSSS